MSKLENSPFKYSAFQLEQKNVRVIARKTFFDGQYTCSARVQTAGIMKTVPSVFNLLVNTMNLPMSTI